MNVDSNGAEKTQWAILLDVLHFDTTIELMGTI